jgi:hypothetical protein
MFEFSSKLKITAIVLVLLGVVSVGLSFLGGSEHQGEGAHQTGHGEHAAAQEKDHAGAAHKENTHHGEGHNEGAHDQAAHGEDQHAKADLEAPSSYHKTGARANPENDPVAVHRGEGAPAQTHHQAQNEPWANLLVNSFFFLAISAGALFFLAVQYAAQAGWTVVILRSLEAMAQFIWVPMVVILLIALTGVFHLGGNHLWHWLAEGITDPQSSHYDSIIAGKAPYLNGPFFIIRTLIYLVGWAGAAALLRKLSLGLEKTGIDYAKQWVKIRKWSVGFLAFFALTSTTGAWDFIMSIDTHWYSTLFGWYVFAGMFISALTALMMVVMYLKKQGYLQEVNPSHIHDMAKFMFAFSIFWTYLWFSQYMLIWYANKPEEATYYMIRFFEFKGLLLTMLVMNFVFPILVLMSRDAKRNFGFIFTAGLIIIAGHWIDVFLMIYPGTVGASASISLINIGTFLGFLGLFILVVFRALSKAPLIPENHPMAVESKYHHI